MDKPLELYVSGASHSVSAANKSTLPFPVEAVVVSKDIYSLDWLTNDLDSFENLKWSSVSYLSTRSVEKDSSHSLVILELPNTEAEAIRALNYGEGLGQDMILIGKNIPPSIMRLAFQYSVSDFISDDALSQNLAISLRKVAIRLSEKTELAPVLAIMNGKAGSGASFIAASLADIISKRDNFKVSLLDTDLHHGTLSHILGLESKYSICDVLSSMDEFDDTALESIMSTRGNLSFLAAKPFELLSLHEEIDLSRNKELLWKCRQHYKQVILDFSRGPEYWNHEMLIDAQILVVTQQNIMHLRQTKDLIKQLTTNIGVSLENISLIVNRYDKSASIKLADIKTTIGLDRIYTITNDYKLSSESVELGKPITELAKKQTMFLDLKRIADELVPLTSSEKRDKGSFWKRLLGN